jgi:5-methylcytosine-specific restriction protein B
MRLVNSLDSGIQLNDNNRTRLARCYFEPSKLNPIQYDIARKWLNSSDRISRIDDNDAIDCKIGQLNGKIVNIKVNREQILPYENDEYMYFLFVINDQVEFYTNLSIPLILRWTLFTDAGNNKNGIAPYEYCSDNTLSYFDILGFGWLRISRNKIQELNNTSLKPLNDNIQALISKYKTIIEKPYLNNEVFKWQLIQKFQGKPDTSAPDFNAEISTIRYENLLYPMSGAVIQHLARTKPEEFRKLLIELFDESKPLVERIKKYMADVAVLYRTIESKQSSHQDERTIATLLTFKYPERYTLYKDSFYQEYCKYLGVKPMEVGQKYIHYLGLIYELIEKYIKPDSDLIDKMLKLLPEDAYKDSSYTLLAQDIIYQSMERDRKVAQKTLFTWVKTHKEITEYLRKMKDKQTELIELLESAGVTEFNDKDVNDKNIRLNEIDPFTFFFYINKYKEVKSLSILQNIATLLDISVPTDTAGIPSVDARKVWIFPFKKDRNNNEINRLWEFFFSAMDDKVTDSQFADIQKIKGVGKPKLTSALFIINPDKYLPINKQTEPYIKTKLGLNPDFNSYSEYSMLLDKIREKDNAPFYEISQKAWLWDGADEQGGIYPTKTFSYNTNASPLNCILYGPPGTGKTYNTVNKALEILGIDLIGKTRAEIKQLFDDKMKEGQIVFTTFHQSISYEDFIEGIKPQTKNNNVQYEIQDGIFKKICSKAGQGNSKTIIIIKPHTVVNSSIGIDEFKKLYNIFVSKLPVDSKEDSDIVLQTVTGKNFYLFRNSRGSIVVRASTKNASMSVSCNELIGVRYQGKEPSFQSYENIIINEILAGVKEIDNENVENNNTVTEEKFRQLYDNYLNKLPDESQTVSNEFIKTKTGKEVFLFKNKNNTMVLRPKSTGNNLYQTYNRFRRSYFDKIELDHEYIPFILKKILENEGIKLNTLENQNDLRQSEQLNTPTPYVLIIDEINRGNVAQIFGELITLIEEDKRLGNAEALEVTLPYSKEKFGVPPNLYIIGTMNTADRSIEALDTALRRRFCFEEMYPRYDLDELSIEIAGVYLKDLLKKINDRIEKLLDKDHMIGHSYFMSINNIKDLKAVFQNKVIPLLQEYFFGDFGKIGLVLGAGFFENDGKQDEGNKSIFASFDDYEDDELSNRHIYRLKNVVQMDDNEFTDAIAILMS